MKSWKIALVVLLILLILGTVITVVSLKSFYKIWPAPKPIITTENIHKLDPNNYWYEFYIPGLENLTNRFILENLVWDNFSQDSERRLKHDYEILKSFNVKNRQELRVYNERLREDTLKHLHDETRTNRVFSIDLKGLKRILGDVAFSHLNKYFGPFDKCHIMRLWFNSSGYTTPLHGDMTPIGVLHLTGCKRWVFADKHNISNCYAKSNQNGHLYCAPSNPYKQKELSKLYPKFGRIKFTHIDVLPGTLYSFPRKMIHFVHTLKPSFMLSINFSSKDLNWPKAK